MRATRKKEGFILFIGRNKAVAEKPKPVFTDNYFLSKAKEMVALGQI